MPRHPDSAYPPSCAALQGIISGVLYYFPFENDHETVPVDSTHAGLLGPPPAPAGAVRPTQLRGTQLGAATHRAAGTQAGPRATQHGGIGGAADLDEEEEDAALGWQTHPIFEAFWQGRLIPGARIDSLPFIEAVRQKRNAQVGGALLAACAPAPACVAALTPAAPHAGQGCDP